MFARTRPAAIQGKRIGNRLRLGLPAKLVLTHETRDCVLDDISASGARIAMDSGVATGRNVMLHFHELRVPALVAWCEDGECGLRFEEPLPLEDMQGFLWIKQNPDLYQRICREDATTTWMK